MNTIKDLIVDAANGYLNLPAEYFLLLTLIGLIGVYVIVAISVSLLRSD